MGGVGIDNVGTAFIDEPSSAIHRAFYYANAYSDGFGNDYNANDHPDATEILGNTSDQCSSPVLLNLDHMASCHELYPENKPIWRLVLRWMKIVAYNINRSYRAKPILLVMAPLTLGITIGYFIGRWQQSSSLRTIETGRRQQQPEQGGGILHVYLGNLAERISLLWFRLCLVASRWFSREDISTRRCFATKGSSLSSLPSSLSTKEIPTDCLLVASGSDGTAHSGAHVSKCGSIASDKENNVSIDTSTNTGLKARESNTRKFLKSDEGTSRESGVPLEQVPKHVAVIMDGNRRYGKNKYGSAARGHWDGSSKLVEFAKWCMAEHIAVLTVFAFSSENWKRDPAEISSLMQIFATYCDELRMEAIERNIKIMVLSTDYEKIPAHVRVNVKRMVNETQHCNGMIMNICLSYGSRGEIVGATKLLVDDVLREKLDPETIDEKTIGERLLTHNCGGDPDVMLRTSGELRISNFLLWQLAYTEFFFVDKPWPAMEKTDLIDVIQNYAKGRKRRYGQ